MDSRSAESEIEQRKERFVGVRGRVIVWINREQAEAEGASPQVRPEIYPTIFPVRSGCVWMSQREAEELELGMVYASSLQKRDPRRGSIM